MGRPLCGRLSCASMTSLLLLVPSLCHSQGGPQPPCGKPPVPSWSSANEPAMSKLWSRAEFGRDWMPPACTGWTTPGFTTLVSTVARFQLAPEPSGADALLRRIGAISDRAGTRYWSTTHQKWETLISDAYALTAASGKRRGGFTADEMKT